MTATAHHPASRIRAIIRSAVEALDDLPHACLHVLAGVPGAACVMHPSSGVLCIDTCAPAHEDQHVRPARCDGCGTEGARLVGVTSRADPPRGLWALESTRPGVVGVTGPVVVWGMLVCGDCRVFLPEGGASP